MLNSIFKQVPVKKTEAHIFDPTILREYDIRGVVGKTLTDNDARAIGRAFGTIIRNSGGTRVCICRDGRIHSKLLFEAVSEGLQNCGITVTGIGVGPTPMLYFADRILECDGAIMITGSHNPPEFNGFKIVLGHRPFFGNDILNLANISKAGLFVEGIGHHRNINIDDKYINELLQEKIKAPLKVAWDPGNGSAGTITKDFTQRLLGKHIVINAEINGHFPNHHPDPTDPKNLEQLRNVVLTERCDLGIAFDGDGDRIGVIDDEGEILWGDQLLCLFGEEILKDNPKAIIIADVKASQVFFDHIQKLGGQALMWKTGHSLIKSKMTETGALLAGEMSGHMFFADRYFGFDDALYAAVRLIEILARRGLRLSDFRKSLPYVFNTPEIRIECSDDLKFQALALIELILKGTDHSINAVDGVRVTTPDGWWLLRVSNTQPALVARCEATTPKGLQNLKADLRHYLNIAEISVPKILK